MTRTTDTDDHERFQPLGSPIRKSPEPASKPPHTSPVGPYGIVQLPDGTRRTTRDNLPKEK